MRVSISFLLTMIMCSMAYVSAKSSTLHVGASQQYQRLQQAAQAVKPGDTILLHDGMYSGGDYIENMNGTASAWIVIRALNRGNAVFRGNTQAFHLSDVSYLRIEGLVFEQQTGNGVNIDDGGTYDTPTHHIIIEKCEWRSMNATGNNDELKMSGVDDFTITDCRFRNGSEGGSMIDMVGCHRGFFTNNQFENGGSNAIQAKGATSEMLIHANRFINCGQRAVNVGGSTGLQFFRPLGALYEAKAIRVYANIFVGSVTPIAFVGAVECRVENNTIFKPSRWAFRILQETTEQGFLLCGNNIVRNNVIVMGNTGTVAINIGANTAPQTFTFEYNLWYNTDNSTWSGPNTPVAEPNRILNKDPLFADTITFAIGKNSPCYKAGSPSSTEPSVDFAGVAYSSPRSLGAMEVPNPAHVAEQRDHTTLLYPNPTAGVFQIHAAQPIHHVYLYDILGRQVQLTSDESSPNDIRLDCTAYARGMYTVRITFVSGEYHVVPLQIE